MTDFARNKKALHDFNIEETYEAGISLTGPEVKSIREGRANLKESYARVRDGEVFLIGMHVSPYENATQRDQRPTRDRKLLLHRKEIDRLIGFAFGSLRESGKPVGLTSRLPKRGRAKRSPAPPDSRTHLVSTPEWGIIPTLGAFWLRREWSASSETSRVCWRLVKRRQQRYSPTTSLNWRSLLKQ